MKKFYLLAGSLFIVIVVVLLNGYKIYYSIFPKWLTSEDRFAYEGLPEAIYVGDSGQIIRPEGHIFEGMQYSFYLDSNDDSIFSVDETGHWKTLRPGEVQLTLDVADSKEGTPFYKELKASHQTTNFSNTSEAFYITIDVLEKHNN